MKLIIINGPSGIGKSTLALEIQKDFSLSLLIDIDALRRFIFEYGTYRVESLELVQKETLALTQVHLEAGHDVIIEKAMLRDDGFINELRSLGEKYNAEIVEILLTVEKQTLIDRADKRGFRPGGALTSERVKEMWDESQALPTFRPEAFIIDTTNLTVEETVKKAKELIYKN